MVLCYLITRFLSKKQLLQLINATFFLRNYNINMNSTETGSVKDVLVH